MELKPCQIEEYSKAIKDELGWVNLLGSTKKNFKAILPIVFRLQKVISTEELDALGHEHQLLHEENDLLKEENRFCAEALDMLRTCFNAIKSLPIDSLGVGTEAMTAEDGQAGEMSWPIRDELLHEISGLLTKADKEGE